MTENGFKELLDKVFGHLKHWIPFRLSNAACYPLDGALDLISTIIDSRAQDVAYVGQLAAVMPDVFVAAYVFPTFCDVEEHIAVQVAMEVWTKWEGVANPEQRSMVLDAIKQKLSALVADCSIKPT